MSEQWMPTLKLPMTREQFQQLPRNPAYSYDYLNGTLLIAPRTRHFHGVLTLANWQGAGDESGEPSRVGDRVRPILEDDRRALPEVFAAAFDRVEPFAGLTGAARLAAARDCLDRCWSGGDGPFLEQASFVAMHPENTNLLGAILVTLVPGGDAAAAESYRWDVDPPADHIASKLGQPHITWIFVDPYWKGIGVGTALLDRAVAALGQLGYASLWSTFLLGNDSSMLWHWRNGFELAGFPMSRRRRLTSRDR